MIHQTLRRASRPLTTQSGQQTTPISSCRARSLIQSDLRQADTQYRKGDDANHGAADASFAAEQTRPPQHHAGHGAEQQVAVLVQTDAVQPGRN